MPEPFKARQSALRGYEQCARRAFHEMQVEDDLTIGYSEAFADFGTIVHATAAKMLHALRDTGQTEIPTQELVELLMEAYAESPISLPAEQRDDLIWVTLRLAERVWRADKLLPVPGTDRVAIEERIDVPIRCQDGKTRVLSCQPDALFIGSADTIICADYKSGFAKPKESRAPQEGVPEDTLRGRDWLSDRGHFQADAYGLAALYRYPQAQRFIFRELHLRWGKVREAVMGRDEFEHVERLLGIHLMKMERGLDEGEQSDVWRPRPGPWCAKQCPVSRTCPIPSEMRGRGGIPSSEEADEVASGFVMVDGLRQHLRELLKVNYEATGRPARTGDGRAISWTGGKGGTAFEYIEE